MNPASQEVKWKMNEVQISDVYTKNTHHITGKEETIHHIVSVKISRGDLTLTVSRVIGSSNSGDIPRGIPPYSSGIWGEPSEEQLQELFKDEIEYLKGNRVKIAKKLFSRDYMISRIVKGEIREVTLPTFLPTCYVGQCTLPPREGYKKTENLAGLFYVHQDDYTPCMYSELTSRAQEFIRKLYLTLSSERGGSDESRITGGEMKK